KAMLATVSRLRRLLRNADLATKVVIVMGMRRFYTARRGTRTCVETGLCPVQRGVAPIPHDNLGLVSARIRREFCAAPAAESCPIASAARRPQSESRAAACGGRGGRRRSRGVLSPARPRA